MCVVVCMRVTADESGTEKQRNKVWWREVQTEEWNEEKVTEGENSKERESESEAEQLFLAGQKQVNEKRGENRGTRSKMDPKICRREKERQEMKEEKGVRKK